ncbi:MAG: shikimate kinase [Desulfobulbaceae bacterium]|nr:shikimate kinase [Desulfobulbaceae bacterium]
MAGKKRVADCAQTAIHPERIILTGFRATGKSSVGAMLAERLGLAFVDTDAELCGAIGCSIAEYVARHGWPAFREKERVLLAALARRTGAVIATGGGAIMHENEWHALRRKSRVVWLRADAGTIRRRLRKDEATASQRPSLTGAGSDDEVDELLRSREPLYRSGSDMIIDTAPLAPEEIVNTIIRNLSGET